MSLSPVPATVSPLEALASSAAAWSSQKSLAKSICQAVEAGAWDADIARAGRQPGPGLVERLMLVPPGPGRRFIRRLAVGLLGRGVPAPPEDFVRQLQGLDPLFAAFVLCYRQDPGLLADRAAVEDLWATCQSREGQLKTTAEWLKKRRWDWDTPLMGTRVLDLVLASAQRWLPMPRDPNDSPSAARLKRQRDWLFLANKLEPRYSTPLSRALLWACSGRVLSEAFGTGTIVGSGGPDVELKALLAADDIVPPQAMRSTLEALCAQPGPALAPWIAPVLPGLIARPFGLHVRAQAARESVAADQAVERLITQAAAAHKKPPTAAQKERVRSQATASSSPIRDDHALPPGVSQQRAWELMAQALAGASPRPLPEGLKNVRLAEGLSTPSPLEALRRLDARCGPCPEPAFRQMPQVLRLEWWAALCARLAEPRLPASGEGIGHIVPAAQALKALATVVEGGDPARGVGRARREVILAFQGLQRARQSASVFANTPPPDFQSSPAHRALMLELSLDEPAPSDVLGRTPRL